MEEIWKNIDGYEGIYQVSNLGRVRSLDRRVWNYTKKGNSIVEVGKKLKLGKDFVSDVLKIFDMI